MRKHFLKAIASKNSDRDNLDDNYICEVMLIDFLEY